MVDDRGYGSAAVPPPPPGAPGQGGAADGAPPPPPPGPPAGPAPGQPPIQPWGTPPAAAPGQGWGGGGSEPAGSWGAPSPSAQVGWDRPQRDGGNGCLKGCLIIGGIVAVLGIIGLVALGVLGNQLAQQIAEDPEGFFGGQCEFVSSFEVSQALGADVEVFSLEGFADGTMGAILDKRLLRDAPDCWVIGEDGTAARIAVLEGGGQAAYDAAAETARDFTFRQADDIGDEAFCTTIDDAGSGGVLVRFGSRVVYVSVVQQDFDADNACAQARTIARTLQP